MYVGGGVLGGSNAYPLSDNGSGTWSTTISLLEGTEEIMFSLIVQRGIPIGAQRKYCWTSLCRPKQL